MQTILESVYAGRARPMPGDGRPTGIFKASVAGAVAVGIDGIVGDEQADRRVHGGPEQALHQFPRAHYAVLAEAFPAHAAQFVPGSIGENLSAAGWDETQVCIGDVFAVGSARLQLSQPRAPCWKIDARYGIEGATALIQARGIAGWYYRVLAAGVIQAGAAMSLVERNADPVSLRELWLLEQAHRPELGALRRAAATPGLAPGKRARLERRMAWLEQNG